MPFTAFPLVAGNFILTDAFQELIAATNERMGHPNATEFGIGIAAGHWVQGEDLLSPPNSQALRGMIDGSFSGWVNEHTHPNGDISGETALVPPVNYSGAGSGFVEMLGASPEIPLGEMVGKFATISQLNELWTALKNVLWISGPYAGSAPLSSPVSQPLGVFTGYTRVTDIGTQLQYDVFLDETAIAVGWHIKYWNHPTGGSWTMFAEYTTTGSNHGGGSPPLAGLGWTYIGTIYINKIVGGHYPDEAMGVTYKLPLSYV